MSYWQGKTAVITGASAGLGLAIAKALAQAKANVIAVARGKDRLEQACAALPPSAGEVVPIVADVTRQDDVDRIVQETLGRFGRIDAIVNCAGRSARSAILETSPDELQALWEINLLATARMARACAPHLLATRGHVVNIGSLASKTASPFLGAYPATKHALAAYTQQLRLELASRGVHVLLVCPGPIARPASELRYEGSGDVPAGALRPGGGARLDPLDPHELALEILRACQRRKPELVRPRRARLMFTLAAISPRIGDWLVRRFTKNA